MPTFVPRAWVLGGAAFRVGRWLVGEAAVAVLIIARERRLRHVDHVNGTGHEATRSRTGSWGGENMVSLRSFLLIGSLVGLLACTCSDETAMAAPTASPPNTGEPAQKVAVQNKLAACMAVNVGTVRTDRNVVLVDGTLRATKSIGECGCMSAMLAYRSMSVVQGREHVLAEGGLNSLRLESSPNSVTFVLSTDGARLAPRGWTLIVSCQAPE